VHGIRGGIHRRPDPGFDAKVAAVQHVVTTSADDPHPVLRLDERTAFLVRIPVPADTRDRHGRIRREFEHIRRGTISWYGVQGVATDQVSMRKASTRMDPATFTGLLQELTDQHGPMFTLVMDTGSAHTSRHATSWLAEQPGVTVVHTPIHAFWVNPIESVFGICARQVLRRGRFLVRP
jgi:hypothetical protein